MTEEGENLEEISFEKKVEYLMLVAMVCKVNLNERVAEILVTLYEQLGQKGGDLKLSEIVAIKEQVENKIKERALEKKRLASEGKNLKQGDVKKTWIERNPK